MLVEFMPLNHNYFYKGLNMYIFLQDASLKFDSEEKYSLELTYVFFFF